MDEVTSVSGTVATGHTTSRIEVVSRVSGWRRWTTEQKLAIRRDAFGPEGSLRAACECYEISRAQLYSWRQQAMFGELTRVAPAALPAFAAVEVDEAKGPAPPASANRITIELLSGVRLAMDAGVDPQALARILAVLNR